MSYDIVKALHIIFVVTWFAGLFYIVRLFIYHTEAQAEKEPEKAVLSAYLRKIQRPLWFGITWPSMVLTLIFGSLMLWFNPALFSMPFMHLKLTLVAGLLIYHFICHRMFRRLQQGFFPYSSLKLRLWNEVATLFLFSIVFVIILKQRFDWRYGLIGLALLSLLILWGVYAYKSRRGQK